MSATGKNETSDIYDGDPWTEMDIDDLKAAIEDGCSVADAAELLCRSGTVDEVEKKCDELGLPVTIKQRSAMPINRREP
jgi:hypothetical protein